MINLCPSPHHHQPKLVCGGTDKGCYLLQPERQFVNEIPVHEKALVVEATRLSSTLLSVFAGVGVVSPWLMLARAVEPRAITKLVELTGTFFTRPKKNGLPA